MDKIYVIFWTQGGNTQAMAEAVAEGIAAHMIYGFSDDDIWN